MGGGGLGRGGGRALCAHVPGKMERLELGPASTHACTPCPAACLPTALLPPGDASNAPAGRVRHHRLHPGARLPCGAPVKCAAARQRPGQAVGGGGQVHALRPLPPPALTRSLRGPGLGASLTCSQRLPAMLTLCACSSRQSLLRAGMGDEELLADATNPCYDPGLYQVGPMGPRGNCCLGRRGLGAHLHGAQAYRRAGSPPPPQDHPLQQAGIRRRPPPPTLAPLTPHHRTTRCTCAATWPAWPRR